MALVLGVALVQAEDTDPTSEVRKKALEAVKVGQMTNAVSLVSDAIKAHPQEPRLWNLRAQIRSLSGDSSGAVSDLTEGLRLNPKSALLHQDRAMERFKMGQIPECLQDFDRANELSPELVPYNWQRGIALYYGRRYADGRKQFEAHRAVNANDVENAVWHFLCVARQEGTNAAVKAYMDISGDSRVPMAEIHEMFKGEAPESEVLEAAESAPEDAREKRQARFYAHLYVGLYDDLLGRPDAAREHLRKAVALSGSRDYMGQVARVHLNRLTPTPTATPSKP
jgi:lipoprotein NlpI